MEVSTISWTAPATVVTGEIVVAAWWNAQVRDNLLETSPAKASAAGDLFVGTGANALKRLAKGTARQVPQMNSGATDIEWAPSPQSVLTGEADLLYASAANVLARLAKGTALQGLTMNAGATAPEWAASMQSLLTAIGDIIYASAANTPARLAKGTALQTLQINAAANAPEWAVSPQSILTAQGDLLYASAANVLAKLAKGTAGQVLHMNAGATAPEWATVLEIATGSYAGDDAAPRTITVGFTPKFVIVSGDGSAINVGIGHHSNGLYGITVLAASAGAVNTDVSRPDPTANGFIVDGTGAPSLNDAGATYYWTAIA